MSEIAVVCIGSAKYDTLAWVDHQPREDERIVTDRITNAAGGNANTAAAAVARQRVKVALCTTLGHDPAGDYLLSRMNAFGIDTRYVARRSDIDTPQSINVACGASATRSIITVSSPSIDVAAALSSPTRWFHFDGEGFNAARSAIRAGTVPGRVSVDAGIDIGTLDLHGIDLYAPTKERIIGDFGGDLEQAMQRAVAAGARDVVVTLGSAGCAVLSDGVFSYLPAFPVEVVSTLGAGDVFHGALVAALARDLNLLDAVQCATVSAALACRALDGQSAIPTLDELDQHLAASTRSKPDTP